MTENSQENQSKSKLITILDWTLMISILTILIYYLLVVRPEQTAEAQMIARTCIENPETWQTILQNTTK